MSRGFSGFRPRLVPTIVTACAVLVLVALGIWQLERREWKRALLEERAATLAAAPVPPPQTLPEARRVALRRVRDAGVFLHDKELYLNAIGPQGGAGFDVLTPLREPAGRVVFVNRGFIPTELRDPRTRPAGEPVGTVQVGGRIRLPPDGKPGWFVPDNRPERNFWFWIDLRAMAAADHLTDVAPFYIDADATPNPGGWPKGGTTLPDLPNNHLQYAITWFSLAVAASVIYVLSQRQHAGKR